MPSTIPLNAPVIHPKDFSLQTHANTLGRILSGEFGIPFAIYDSESGLCLSECGALDNPQAPLPPQLSLLQIRALVEQGRNCVEPMRQGQYLLEMVLYLGKQPVLVAVGLYHGLAHNGAELERETRMLEKWMQSVQSRLRLADQVASQSGRTEETANSQPAWEALINLEELIRRLRIPKDSRRNQQRILETAFRQVAVQSLIWIPCSQEEPTLIQGDGATVGDDIRLLALSLAKQPNLMSNGFQIFNQMHTVSWSSKYPQIENLLAFSVRDVKELGYVLAINKTDRAAEGKRLPFRRSDVVQFMPFVALLRLQGSAQGRYQDLKDLLVGLTRSLTAAIDAKDSYTFGHSERVARIALELGRTMGMEGENLSDIYLAGLLHDVGKIGVSDVVLKKPGPLTPAEFEQVKKHVHIGYKILEDVKPIKNILKGVLYHHEAWDGTGYPEKLKGADIPLLARILAVADAFDAMSTSRSYREAMTPAQVEQTFRDGAGKQWDPEVVNALFQCKEKIMAIRQRGVGESLRLALDGVLHVNQDFNVSTR